MKKYLAILIPLFIGLGCFAMYSIIGSHVTPEGVLVEPFAWIPIGYLFLMISIVAGLVMAVKNVLRN